MPGPDIASSYLDRAMKSQDGPKTCPHGNPLSLFCSYCVLDAPAVCGSCGLTRTEHSINGAAYGVCGKFTETATPKPAPDAMRHLLQRCFDGMKKDRENGDDLLWADEHEDLYHAVEAALSAPVPSPDGAGEAIFEARTRGNKFGSFVQEQLNAAQEYKFVGETGFETPWLECPPNFRIEAIEPSNEERTKLGRTFGVALRDRSPSATGAAEPVARGSDAAEADRYFDMAGDFGNRIQRAMEVIKFNIGSINRSVAAELQKILSHPTDAAPPVWGDRESLRATSARAICEADGFDYNGERARAQNGSESARDIIDVAHRYADAILSPVQPGAGEREELIHAICPHIRQWADQVVVARDVLENCIDDLQRMAGHDPNVPGLSYDSLELLVTSAAQAAKQAISSLRLIAAAPASTSGEVNKC